MHIHGNSPPWDLPLPDHLRDVASKGLSKKMGAIRNRILELNSSIEAANGIKNLSHKLGISEESRELKTLEALDKELLETFSAIKKGPASDHTIGEMLAQKKDEIAHTPKGPKRERLQAELKGLELIRTYAPEVTKLEKLQFLERTYLGRRSEFIQEIDAGIDEEGLKKALQEHTDSESEDSLIENLKKLEDFQKRIDQTTDDH